MSPCFINLFLERVFVWHQKKKGREEFCGNESVCVIIDLVCG